MQDETEVHPKHDSCSNFITVLSATNETQTRKLKCQHNTNILARGEEIQARLINTFKVPLK